MNIESSEHEFLKSLVFWRYVIGREKAFDLFQPCHKSALEKSRYAEVIALEADYQKTQNTLYQEFETGEDIISWLELDAELRKHNLNYPDIIELCTQQPKNK